MANITELTLIDVRRGAREMVDHGTRAGVEGLEAGAKGILVVVGPLHEGFRGDVVETCALGRIVREVVDSTRRWVDPSI